MSELDPSAIMQIGMGFFASKTLLSAVELGLFTELAKQPMTAAELAGAWSSPSRGSRFSGCSRRFETPSAPGRWTQWHVRNTPEGAAFLDRNSPNYIGGILEMATALASFLHHGEGSDAVDVRQASG